MKKLVCLFIVWMLSLGCIIGCSEKKSVHKKQEKIAEEKQTTEKEQTAEKTTPKMDMEHPIKELYSEEFVDTTSTPSTNISYHVPQINCDTEDAKQINDEIKEKYAPIVEGELESKRDGVSVICYSIKWELIRQNDYSFALIISRAFPGGCIYYDLYNFDGMDGTVIKNKEILKTVNLTDDEFVKLTKAKCAQRYQDKYDQVKEMMPSDYQNQLDYTVSDERIHINMPMFIDENGGLSVIGDIGSLAGAGNYYEIVKIK